MLVGGWLDVPPSALDRDEIINFKTIPKKYLEIEKQYQKKKPLRFRVLFSRRSVSLLFVGLRSVRKISKIQFSVVVGGWFDVGQVVV